MTYFIKGNYYFDFDTKNQLRITGPQNHLLLGVKFPEKVKIILNGYDLRKNLLWIHLVFNRKNLTFNVPVVTDVRTLRNHIEGKGSRPTFFDLTKEENEDLLPSEIKKFNKRGKTYFKFIKKYTDELGKKRKYGVKLSFPDSYKLQINSKDLQIESPDKIDLVIETISNVPIRHRIKKVSFSESEVITSKNFSGYLKKLYSNASVEVAYLLKAQKTSSFEYGTIFPRDWIESADLGEGDLSKTVIDYMYSQAMKHISETGEAWHEDIVGSYREKVGNAGVSVDRKMIDIEPHYIIGMNYMSKKLLLNKDIQKKIKKVGEFIINKAETEELITFKRLPDSEAEFYKVGNWRDSQSAFPGHEAYLAPFDVNCVFYPVALKIIKKYGDFFEVTDPEKLDKTIEKWDKNKQKFMMYHPQDITGYALALHGMKRKQLPVAHLDEAYDHFYSYPSLEDVVSFSLKLIDPDFFYTPVGPLLVANDEDDFTTREYHGKVIWPKQVAFAVAGLGKQYRRGLAESWPQSVMDTIKNSIVKTSKACFNGWKDLKVVPELYYYDEKSGKARLYTDQEEYEGQMSLIQLWSLVGLRRIMREYHFILNK